MFTIEEKKYLTDQFEINDEHLDFFRGDIEVTIEFSKALNEGKFLSGLKKEIRSVLNKIGGFGDTDSFLIFYFSDDVGDPSSKAKYEVKSDIVSVDNCEEKVLEVMGREDFVKWSHNSEKLNRFLPFSQHDFTN